MANSKLMEAAADILAGSKKSAGSTPMQKMPGSEVQDLGGATPENGKPDDDSLKIHAGKGATQTAAPTTKPSAASAKMEETELDGEQLDESDIGDGYKIKMKHTDKGRIHSPSGEHVADVTKHESGWQYHSGGKNWDGSETSKHYKTGVEKTKMAAAKKASQIHMNENEIIDEMMHDKAMKMKMKMKEKMKEDIDALFSDDDTISEEFKGKVSTIFEARVNDRVTQIQEEIENQYAGMLEEAIDTIKTDLTEKVDDYLSYVVEQWMAENEIAVESGLRAELTEDFIGGLRNLFAEHYIDVPADKVDLVDELAGKVEELESKLNEEIESNVQLKKHLVESYKNEIAHEVCESLTDTQAEKVKALAESVDYSTEEEYKQKLETIRENYFPSGAKKADVKDLHEQVEDGSEKHQVSSDPYVNSVMQAISKTKL